MQDSFFSVATADAGTRAQIAQSVAQARQLPSPQDLAGCAYVSEALRIVDEGTADFATVDRILQDQAGASLGPFALQARLGAVPALAAMEAVYRLQHEEPRLRPGGPAALRLAADPAALQPFTEQAVPAPAELPPVWVSTRAARRAELYQLLKDLGARIETGQSPSPQALSLVASLGFDVTTVAVVERLDPARTVGIDMLVEDAATKRRVLATNPATRPDMRDAAHALFARDGKAVSVVRDTGGFVTQRVLAAVVNQACDACQQRLGTPAALDAAIARDLGLAQGPLAMGNRWGPSSILEVLFNLQTVYGDTRYRPSPWLRRRGAIGLSLLQDEN